ncbi:MAG: quinone-dependent dihydroorotate dehydrogenase, partial [Pseudomonadota bacterium]
NAEAIDGCFGLGFGFVEIGAVTPRPQPGNPQPRLFRLPDDRALINRMGFNNDGGAAIGARVDSWRLNGRWRDAPLGVNLGKNKDSPDAAADFAAGAARFARCADFLTINVSSPNTPGLRALQAIDQLRGIAAAARRAADGAAASPQGMRADDAPPSPAILAKIAPDLDEEEIDAVAEMARDGAVDGLVAVNTTLARPDDLTGSQRNEAGGLSGPPLQARARAVVGRLRRVAGPRPTIIGVGGVATGADAYGLILAGANRVQLYTGLIYGGPDTPRRIALELADRLRADGFSHVDDAVGATSSDALNPQG